MTDMGRGHDAGAAPLRELTVRGIILGGLITLVFTAANVYLGLKVGLTFATSIPAAVISMAVLRWFASSNILENNIVQTVASAAGTLAAIIFVLPGLVIVGWWQGFPFWTTALVCALGGILGVMFSIPLRRALVVDSPLPYPEGAAAAEVLRVGAASREGAAENKAGLRTIVVGSLASAGFSLLVGMRLALAEVGHYFRVGPAASGIAGGLSFALIGVGHLVGLSVGLAMFAGYLIAWGVATPILTAAAPAPGPAEGFALGVWATQVRFIGAGVIGVAAIWTLLSIIGPILKGISSAIAASRARRGGTTILELSERDLPIGIVGAVSLAALIPIALLLYNFLRGGALEDMMPVLVFGAVVYIVVIGAFIAAVCGYMAGLIGASNSPVSGVGILSVLGASLLLVFVMGRQGDPSATPHLVAYALFTTAMVFSVATISNDNLQDLKTGQLVGATPWKQQVALIFGVCFGSLVIPPVLDLLNQAYGFAGTPGATAGALPAPQANLIAALATGVLGGDLDWSLIMTGAGLGIVIILADVALGRMGKLRLPPLAIGIGIYLPAATTIAVTIGAVLGWLYDRNAERRSRDPEAAKRMGVLLATGLIVGESLFGVALAGIVVGTGNDTPFAVVGEGHETVIALLGIAIFAALTAWLYRRTARAGNA